MREKATRIFKTLELLLHASTVFTFAFHRVIVISKIIEIRNEFDEGMLTMGDVSMETNQAIKVHRALGEQTRYRIVQILTKESNLCPADLESRLESVALSTLSHHLKQLADSGLLVSQKKGTYIYYSLHVDTVKKFAPYMLD